MLLYTNYWCAATNFMFLNKRRRRRRSYFTWVVIVIKDEPCGGMMMMMMEWKLERLQFKTKKAIQFPPPMRQWWPGRQFLILCAKCFFFSWNSPPFTVNRRSSMTQRNGEPSSLISVNRQKNAAVSKQCACGSSNVYFSLSFSLVVVGHNQIS